MKHRVLPSLRPLVFTALLAAMACPGSAAGGNSRLDPSGSFSIRWWTVEDGLPEVPLTSLAVGRDGAVWCASRTHLMRFDGQVFAPLPAAITDHLYRTTGSFISLSFDGTGRLLVMGPSGLAWCPRGLDPMRAAFAEWKVIRRPEAGLGQMFLDGHGIAHFVDRGVILRHVDGALVELPEKVPPEKVPFYGAAIDHQARDLWVWGWGKARRVAAGEMHDDARALGNRIINMAAGPSGVWAGLVSLDAGTVDGAAVFRNGSWEEHPMPTKPRTPTREGHVREGPDGTVWLATHASFHALRDAVWTPVVEGLNDFSLATQDMETDRHGFLWAACKGGLLALGPTRLRVAPVPPCSVIHRRQDGVMLAGLPGEIVALQPPSDGRPLARTRLAALPGNVVPTCIAETGDGTIFVGSRDSFIYRIRNDEVKLLTQFPGVAMEVRNVSAIVCDAAGRVWAGTDNGLSEYDAASHAFRFVFPRVDAAPTPVLGLFPDDDGTLLVAMQGRGIERLEADGHMIREVPADLMPGRRVIRFCRTADDTLWIAGDGGLLRWDRAGHKMLIDQRHGLVERAVVQVAADEGGRLWLAMRDGHLQGIRIADLDGLAAGRQTAVRGIVLGPLDGIGEREVLGGCGFLDDNTLLLSTAGGMATIDTTSLASDDEGRPGRTVSLERVPLEQGACFRYSAVTTDAFDPPLYQTRLSGVDPDWSPPAAGGERMYAAIPPGKHRFEVRHVRGDDATTFPRAALEIDVPPALWQTGWFIGLVAATAAALAGGMAALVSRMLTRRRIAALEWERERERDRIRIARDIHDSLGAGLTQMALMSDLLRQTSRVPQAVAGGPGAEAGVTLDDLYDSARRLTRSVDEIVWAVNPANDTLDRVIAFIAHDVESMARSGGLDLEVRIPDDLPDMVVASQVRHHVCMIVREAVANVLEHAAAQTLSFSLLVRDERLVIEIGDDGVGFAERQAHAAVHNGLTNMRARAAECGGTLALETAAGRGARVVLEVPLRPPAIASRPPLLRIHGHDGAGDGPRRRA
jgi:signal transduction histidine kinase